MTGVRTDLHLALGLGCCMVLASGSVASDEAAFTFPTLKSQPVAIQRVVRSPDHYALQVHNRSSRTINEIAFTFAGTTCTRPYKPGWPTELREGLDLPPGGYASIDISKSIVDGVAARTVASCGHAMATEIAVTRVRFADGSNWDLGERVRAGEKHDDR